MAELLKHFFSPALVERLAESIARVHPAFPVAAFTRRAKAGLDELELLDRGKHLSRVLAQHLPEPYPDALAILLRSLGPEHSEPELLGAGIAPFFYLPHTLFVAERGLEHFELSLAAQYELTKRFSAESSIRPFIARDPERCLAQLRVWASDPNAHVRRLVSEGTRMRLPWAMRVPYLDREPERVLALLELLKDDPSPFVRRSVANNLNDLGKVHPALLARTASAWLQDATLERRALLEHALRSAVKRGEPDALRLLGYGEPPSVEVACLQLTPRAPRIGERVELRYRVKSRARRSQQLLVDLAVHFVKANGATAPKVFKGKRVALAAGAEVELQSRVSFAALTTRRHYPGRHRAELLINGVTYPLTEFRVR